MFAKRSIWAGWLFTLTGLSPLAWGQVVPPTATVPAPAPLLATSLPSSAVPMPAVVPHGRVGVAFWNLQWFPGHRPGAGVRAQEHHVAQVLPVAERLDADVLGLEEVGDVAAARRLTDKMPGFHVDACTEFTREPNHEPSRQQIVLCSRLPLLGGGWRPFHADAHGLLPRRGFAFAAYRLPGTPGEVLLVYGLHLKSNVQDEPGGDRTNTAMREESMRQVLAHERTATAACTRWGRVRLAVIGGDMNASLDDPRFEAEGTLRALTSPEGGFRWAWQGVPLPLRLTLPGGGPYPPACFDHVFYRGDGVGLVRPALEAMDRGVSDHRPVSAHFDW